VPGQVLYWAGQTSLHHTLRDNAQNEPSLNYFDLNGVLVLSEHPKIGSDDEV